MPVRQVQDLRPNPYNKTLFDKSLQEDDPGLIYLTEDISREGLRHPIFCRPDGMIIDGERRWRAVSMLGWFTVNTIEKDIPDDEVLDYIVRAVSSARQSTMREQARVYLAYKTHMKATTKLPRDERRIQAMQRAHFSFENPDIADQVVAVFQKGDATLQERLLKDRIGVTSAFNILKRGHHRPHLGVERKKKRELEQELAAKYADAQKEAEPGDVDVTTGLPATYADHRLDPLVEQAFARIVEPEKPPEPPKPIDLDALFDETLQKIWVRDTPETTLTRLMHAFANGIHAIHMGDPARAQKCLRNSFEILRPLTKLNG